MTQVSTRRRLSCSVLAAWSVSSGSAFSSSSAPAATSTRLQSPAGNLPLEDTRASVRSTVDVHSLSHVCMYRWLRSLSIYFSGSTCRSNPLSTYLSALSISGYLQVASNPRRSIHLDLSICLAIYPALSIWTTYLSRAIHLWVYVRRRTERTPPEECTRWGEAENDENRHRGLPPTFPLKARLFGVLTNAWAAVFSTTSGSVTSSVKSLMGAPSELATRATPGKALSFF